jgi:hypothetical protein
MTPEERSAFAKMKTFCANILKTLAPPLLREIESSSRSRLDTEPFMPRHVTHASSAPAGIMPATKKAIAVETALLRALGITPVNLTVDDMALNELRHFFDSPIRECHL